MTSAGLIHVVPQLPPAVCGIGDYATVVGNRMEKLSTDIRCQYLGAGHRASELIDTPATYRGLERQYADRFWRVAEEITNELDADAIALIVNYSGYGYDATGAPAWLAKALEARAAYLPDCRIITFFHELFATGLPWQRAFWTSRAQRHVAERIARASDQVLTNRAASAHWLEQVSGRPEGSVSYLPVPSNVGEPEAIVPWSQRDDIAVLFGSERFKRSFLVRQPAETIRLCNKLRIETLIDIGQPTTFNCPPFTEAGLNVEQLGFFNAKDIGPYLARARVAFVDYFPGYFSKSGVLAAAAAHGTPPIMYQSSGASDGLEFGNNLVSFRDALTLTDDRLAQLLDRTSISIYRWYRPHNSIEHARRQMAACFAEVPQVC
jgi:hypothetical protein